MFAKEAVTSSSPVIFNLIRYLISTIIFLVVGGKFIFNKDIFILAIFTTSSSVLWAYGLIYVSPAESAVLSYTMPLFSLPMAFLIINEKPTYLEYLGLSIGFLGVVLYSLPLTSNFGSLFGGLLTILNAVFWAGFTIYYRKLKDYNAYDVNFSQFLLGSLILTVFIPFSHTLKLTYNFIEGIIYTSTLGGALTFLLWNMLAKIERVSRLTVMSFSVPIFSTLIQVCENGEIPPIISIIGISLMFIGILISRMKKLNFSNIIS